MLYIYIYKTQILNDTWLIIPSVGGFLLLYKTVGRKHKNMSMIGMADTSMG